MDKGRLSCRIVVEHTMRRSAWVDVDHKSDDVDGLTRDQHEKR